MEDSTILENKIGCPNCSDTTVKVLEHDTKCLSYHLSTDLKYYKINQYRFCCQSCWENFFKYEMIFLNDFKQEQIKMKPYNEKTIKPDEVNFNGK